MSLHWCSPGAKHRLAPCENLMVTFPGRCPCPTYELAGAQWGHTSPKFSQWPSKVLNAAVCLHTVPFPLPSPQGSALYWLKPNSFNNPWASGPALAWKTDETPFLNLHYLTFHLTQNPTSHLEGNKRAAFSQRCLLVHRLSHPTCII